MYKFHNKEWKKELNEEKEDSFFEKGFDDNKNITMITLNVQHDHYQEHILNSNERYKIL
jgi:hypothetical protein